MKNKKIFYRVMNALSDSRRVRILGLLNKKIMCVSEIQKELRLSQSEVSKQLGVLKNACLVHSFKFGYGGYCRPVFYYLGKAKYAPKGSKFIYSKSAKKTNYISSRIDNNVNFIFEVDLWSSYFTSINEDYNYAGELLNLLRHHLDF